MKVTGPSPIYIAKWNQRQCDWVYRMVLSLYLCSPMSCERQLVYCLNKSFHASGNFFFFFNEYNIGPSMDWDIWKQGLYSLSFEAPVWICYRKENTSCKERHEVAWVTKNTNNYVQKDRDSINIGMESLSMIPKAQD